MGTHTRAIALPAGADAPRYHISKGVFVQQNIDHHNQFITMTTALTTDMEQAPDASGLGTGSSDRPDACLFPKAAPHDNDGSLGDRMSSRRSTMQVQFSLARHYPRRKAAVPLTPPVSASDALL
ncbi:hypothetical protein COCC4DRAFT_20962 [Bipolaris maydis ATCC 48331]|uniref:Uncharacterized protein n=2 Tax=Cochliobolus heterostrophus TaxID=5016 RepID=M2UFC5_COCH5|nr:uncharacterized protein COCC4DRAFT_20962 [Bipolaris maydis ATCC 48331]EMD92381.1 hypothetical protein COCHEDRAFT_1029839 [Bipolaris maydis C5]ENI08072.1 hypothetical protein COCC4DRAFT_20962 [Bipolaris maydis ATCC 48331]KAH7550987.1 hypothetical protein BM1_10360 [Bipolaris maydis]